MTTYRLETEADRKLAMSRLTTVEVGKGWRCKITRSDKRRDAQNALNWKWCTAIAEQMHDTKEDVHNYNKLRFGVVILSRDDDEFNAVWTALSDTLDYQEQLEAIRFIDVTKIMSVKQMKEYLTDIDNYYTGVGIILPRRDDEYFEALGYKRKAA